MLNISNEDGTRAVYVELAPSRLELFVVSIGLLLALAGILLTGLPGPVTLALSVLVSSWSLAQASDVLKLIGDSIREIHVHEDGAALLKSKDGVCAAGLHRIIYASNWLTRLEFVVQPADESVLYPDPDAIGSRSARKVRVTILPDSATSAQRRRLAVFLNCLFSPTG